MNYESQNKVRQQTKMILDKIMDFYPKDYSDATIQNIRNDIEGRINNHLNDFKDAFCKDHNLCPICITGGWDCSSDHK